MMQACKPGSVCQPEVNTLIIYLALPLPTGSICLPFHIGREPSNVGICGISPHRVYLISLQHYLYMLSVALVLCRPLADMTAVSRYASLWCPDFPPRKISGR